MCYLANTLLNSRLIKSAVNLRPCRVSPPAGEAARRVFSGKALQLSFSFPPLLLFALWQSVLKKLLWVQQFKVSLINNTGKSAGTRRGAKIKHSAVRSAENGFSQHYAAGRLLACRCFCFFLSSFLSVRRRLARFSRDNDTRDLLTRPCNASSSLPWTYWFRHKRHHQSTGENCSDLSTWQLSQQCNRTEGRDFKRALEEQWAYSGIKMYWRSKWRTVTNQRSSGKYGALLSH